MAKFETIKMKAPEGVSGFAHEGIEFKADKKTGLFEFPVNLEPHAAAHGFSRHDAKESDKE